MRGGFAYCGSTRATPGVDVAGHGARASAQKTPRRTRALRGHRRLPRCAPRARGCAIRGGYVTLRASTWRLLCASIMGAGLGSCPRRGSVPSAGRRHLPGLGISSNNMPTSAARLACRPRGSLLAARMVGQLELGERPVWPLIWAGDGVAACVTYLPRGIVKNSILPSARSSARDYDDGVRGCHSPS